MTITTRGGSALGGTLLQSIQSGSLSYTYKGIPTLKNPFDLALYQMLLWEVRPGAIIEIGSHSGGSALWFADMARALDFSAEIHSIDLYPVADVAAPGVTFHRGDARALGYSLSDEFMHRLPRPLLVVEDSDHQKDTVLAVLDFFHRWLSPGEYIIVEDGIVSELGIADEFAGGPQAALADFLARHATEYAIDTRYCDHYGENVTYAVNGYLRRRGGNEGRDTTGWLSLRFGADDARMRVRAGTRTEDAIRIAEADRGVVLWGQYLALPAGSYRAILRFHRDRPCRGRAVMDVCAENGRRVLGRLSIRGEQLATAGMAAAIEFSALEALSAVEVRLGADGSFVGDIESLEISGLPVAVNAELQSGSRPR